ncbi:MAG: DUF1566 domain-containing protein [Nitrospinae bacterium]|nr:DUF1566 domain-containing protein [Nitrospinota bacterium]MBL7021073.1 DUF1566 domain-containing protein [Nitrospinaceae bacterium]
MIPKSMIRLFRLLTQPLQLVFLMLAVCVASEVQADSGSGSTDEIFGGQILSLTEEKPPLKPSNDPRFQDNKDGTVTDLKEKLMWKQIDIYQEKKIWINWNDAQTYLEKFNKEAFVGYSDWRLPTRKELESLYEEGKDVPWKYYWTENVIHIDPIFGYSSCCFWSSEVYKDEYAWGFNYIRGRTYPSARGGPGLSLSTIRPVRTILGIDSGNAAP